MPSKHTKLVKISIVRTKTTGPRIEYVAYIKSYSHSVYSIRAIIARHLEKDCNFEWAEVPADYKPKLLITIPIYE